MIDMATARSRHPGGVNVLMGDGSSRFILGTISQEVSRRIGHAERGRARRLNRFVFLDPHRTTAFDHKEILPCFAGSV